MNSETNHDPADAYLRRIEEQLSELLRLCAYLKEENNALRGRQERLVAERAELVEKNELARSRVEAIISRLKAMET